MKDEQLESESFRTGSRSFWTGEFTINWKLKRIEYKLINRLASTSDLVIIPFSNIVKVEKQGSFFEEFFMKSNWGYHLSMTIKLKDESEEEIIFKPVHKFSNYSNNREFLYNRIIKIISENEGQQLGEVQGYEHLKESREKVTTASRNTLLVIIIIPMIFFLLTFCCIFGNTILTAILGARNF